MEKRLPGGIWDKLGNRYESLWTVDALLSVLRGDAVGLTVEPHGEDGEGVEFYTDFANGSREYLSAKRQTTGEMWSLAVLTRPKETGRSILGDLFNRLGDASSINHAVFASQTTPNKLQRLCEEAKRAASAKVFEQVVGGSADLANECDKYILQRLSLDWPGAWNRLRRLSVKGVDEASLHNWIERLVGRDLVRTDSAAFSPAAARLVMYELVYESFGRTIGHDEIVAHLAKEQFTVRDWSLPTPDQDTLGRRNRLYSEGVELELIQNTSIPRRREVETIIEALDAGKSTIVLAGAAGMGKSCVLAQCLRVLTQRNTPHFALRLDAQANAASAAAFGRDLGFTLSPVAVLSGVARGQLAVLVIDQLDSLSTASGRNPRLWDLFQELLFEVKHFGQIRLLLACRAYDLESDDRLRTVVEQKDVAVRVNLEALPLETVREVLVQAGAPVEKFSSRHLELLRTPLHLSVFLQGDPQSTHPASDLTQLYDRFWQRKRDDARIRRITPVHFEETVQRLADWLSKHQTLSAPRDIFKELDTDAQALASDHVLSLAEKSCRFFHETFFDYTFARGFVTDGKQLVPDLLPAGEEQHLFRRSQVRQVLAYQRGREGGFTAYLSDLRDLLTAQRVRFHLKKVVLDWLSSLPDPTVQEWQILSEFLLDTRLGNFVRVVPWNRPAWFPVLRDSGTLAAWLDSADPRIVNYTIRLLGLPENMKTHSAAVAALVAPRLTNTPEWKNRLVALCDHAGVHHSREFFDIFFSKFRDGWFDDRMKLDWYWLAGMCTDHPDYAGEFLSEYLRHFGKPDMSGAESTFVTIPYRLTPQFFTDLKKAKPLPVLKSVLPVLTEVLRANSRTYENGDTLDPLSSCTHLDEPYRFGDALMQYLVSACSSLAASNPSELSALTGDLETLPNSSVAFLLEHAWAANGAYFADKAAAYLSDSRTHLTIKYSEDTSEPTVTRRLLAAIGPHISEPEFRKLENAILNFRDEWECENREWCGYTEYVLLLALAEARLSKDSWHRLDELRRKFGEREFTEPAKRQAIFAASPIPLETAFKLRDRDWLRAMQKFGQGRILRRPGRTTMDIGAFAVNLEVVAQCDKQRFARLLLSLPESIPPRYYDAILSGICKTAVDDKIKDKVTAGAYAPLDIETIVQCAMRVHGLPGRPSGRPICWSIINISNRELPESLLSVIAYYAQNDPDPQSEDWQKLRGDVPMYGGDAYSYGINTVRGAAAETIQRFLYDDAARWSLLQVAVLSLVCDPSPSVRSCAVGCLLARMKENRNEAVTLFMQLIEGKDLILGTHYIDLFLYYAAFSHYDIIRSLLHHMLTLTDNAAEFASRQITVAAFSNEAAKRDLHDRVLNGDKALRAAAAGVFAHNLQNPECADACREQLRFLFHDPSEAVQQQAGNCWHDLNAEQLVSERGLINDFINSPALSQGIGSLVRALDECPERLPDEVLLIPERLIEDQERRASAGANRLNDYFYQSSKLVMHLYQQSRAHRGNAASANFETRCLDVIDKMLVADLGAMDSELGKLEK